MVLNTASLRIAFDFVASALVFLSYFCTYRPTRSAYSDWWCITLVFFPRRFHVLPAERDRPSSLSQPTRKYPAGDRRPLLPTTSPSALFLPSHCSPWPPPHWTTPP